MLPYIITLVVTLLVLATLRLFYILPRGKGTLLHSPPRPRLPALHNPAHLMVLLGSGGHTAEMLLLLHTLNKSLSCRRTYIITTGDYLSAKKAALADASPETIIRSIPRARRVGQSWASAPFDCVKCLWGCMQVFIQDGVPDVLLCNGPGSAVLMVFMAVLLKFVGFANTRTVYAESFARVKSLSLSGRVVYPLCDRFLVQWPELRERYPRAEYRGILI